VILDSRAHVVKIIEVERTGWRGRRGGEQIDIHEDNVSSVEVLWLDVYMKMCVRHSQERMGKQTCRRTQVLQTPRE
jgi:hypothetical protein